MIKAFISHSSKQKHFALDLVNLIGRDYCIIDCYDFEPAYKTVDEIYRAIEKCTVFVLLISRESLLSPWVKEEVSKAVTRFSPSQYDRFWPFIIDQSLSVDECPDWIKTKESFNLHTFVTPELLRLDIEQKFRRMIWRENPDIMARETNLIGRQDELGQFEEIVYSRSGKYLRALVVSGRPGVGKDAFARQCLHKLGRPQELEPCRVSLDAKNGVVDLIIQLNVITMLYNNDQLKSILSGSYQSIIDTAVELLNYIFDMREVVFIDDNMACVMPDRDYPKWLEDIINHEDLNPQLGIFIKSRITPFAYHHEDLLRIANIQLHPLKKVDRKKLFYSLAQTYKLDDFTDADVIFFVERLLESPSQIHHAVKAISQQGMALAKRDITRLISMGDLRARPLIDHFREKALSLHILIILAKYEFLGFDILEEIFEGQEESLQASLSDMIVYGVITTFGRSGEYIRLDHYICDYIRRNHISLPRDISQVVDEVIENRIINANITKDISVYFYDLRQKILQGRYSSDSYLVPSVIVKAIIEAYNDQNYNLVNSICEKVLEDGHSFYDEVYWEIIYWYCLSLCRNIHRNPQHKDLFWNYVRKIKGADSYFLKGFYYRYSENYPEAERNFLIALDKAPNMDRAKRELVTVLIELGKYDEALLLAKENYERDRGENTYHIYAFFRCLVRQRHLSADDKAQLQQLMQEVEDSYSDKKDEIYAAMEIDYAYLIEHRNPKEMQSLIDDLTKEFPRSPNVSRAVGEYRRSRRRF